MALDFQKARGVRRRFVSKDGRMKPGMLYPVSATRIKPSEGGMVNVDLTMELDPVAGRLRSAVTAEMVALFVPLQAVHVLMDPGGATAGMTEVIKKALLTGAALYNLEAETWTSKQLGISPKSTGGVKQTLSFARLAVNAAINFLRLEKYENATKLLHTNDALTPALLSSTILDKMNGVLDPEDRVNGAVRLQLPTINLPVLNTVYNSSSASVAPSVIDGDAGGAARPGINTDRAVGVDLTQSMPGNANVKIWAQLTGQSAGQISLDDFYTAKRMDELTRMMRDIMDEHKELGAENILRWVHGLTMDAGKECIKLMHREVEFGKDTIEAMDSAGVVNETLRTDMAVRFSLNLPIPRTELGGAVIVFAAWKPDETLGRVPDPDWTEPLGVDNFAADELKMMDPQPVTFRELDSDCPMGVESNVAMYTGLNALRQTYVDFGFNGHVDVNTVESKNTIWQAKIPLSVSPEGILFPAVVAYPFNNQIDPCRYNVTTTAAITTPMIVGATPVEELPIIDSANLFEE